MTVTHRLRPAELFRDAPLLAPPLGDLEFRCIAATATMQDDGYALQMSGADLEWFASGRAPLLRQHRPEAIVGRIVAARTTATELLVTCRFASPGISPLADETRGLLRDGVLNAVSLGFSVDERQPAPEGGWLATRWRALELSLVSVPMDTSALVTQRMRAAIGSPRARPVSRYTDPFGFAVAHADGVFRAAGRRDFERRQVELRQLRGAVR